jgi:hypothetical protein
MARLYASSIYSQSVFAHQAASVFMATHLMFGTLRQAGRNAVSARRSEDALALIEKHAGAFDKLAAA